MVESPSSSPPQIFVNGKKVNSDQIFESSFSEDKIFVFESLRSYKGRVFRLNEHLDRLFESAKTVGLQLPKTRAQIKKEIAACLAYCDKQNAFIRLTLDGKDSFIIILDRKRPAWIYEKGVNLKTAVTRRNFINAAPPEPKTSAFFNNVLGVMEQHGSDAYESIFLDSNGYVTEATVWNLFMAKEGKIFTPQAGILNGVTRQFVIKCAEQESFPVFESNLTRHDFWNADEAFLTNTSGEIVPIRSLDGRIVGREIPGVVTERLMLRFRKELERELGVHED